MTSKQKKSLLQEMTQKCSSYIKDDFKSHLSEVIHKRLSSAGIKANEWELTIDESDPDEQTLSFYYPTITTHTNGYIKKAVKLEAGSKSALNPYQYGSLEPYIAKYLPGLNLSVSNITTILPSRTLWDKFIILHSLNHRSLNGWSPNDGHRNSRHYYDIFRLMSDTKCIKAIHDFKLSTDVQIHTQQYFNRSSANLEMARHQTISLTPNSLLEKSLRKDYDNMKGMIFGQQPTFDEILSVVQWTEKSLHETPLITFKD